MTPRRYQLKKEAVGVVLRDHPWVFRDTISSASTAFRDGEWMRLVDGHNRTLGFGMYEAEGAIAIRVLRRGNDAPNAAWVRAQVTAALARREQLAKTTDGLRLVHGENDGLPGVVIDRFGDTLVAQSYTRGADALARYAAIVIARELGVPNVSLVPAHRRRGATAEPRALRGAPRETATFTEDGVRFTVDLASGQKSGTYLDLRALRRAVRAAPLTGARVLNTFAYSGMLGRAAELAGAAHVVQVDQSERALAFAKAHHVGDAGKHELVTADVFDWLPAHQAAEYDLVIVDPPAMTSNKQQVPAVLAGYRKLYRAAAPLVKVGGAIVAACCTSRIERAKFEAIVAETLGPGFVRETSLPPEPDHPVGFAQADYLKIGWYRRKS